METVLSSLAYHKPALLGWLHYLVKSAFSGAAFEGKELNQTTCDSSISNVCPTETVYMLMPNITPAAEMLQYIAE